MRLAPDALLVPCGTLRALLRKTGRIEVLCTGFTLEPWVRNGDRVILDSRRPARAGDLALCEVEGWGDIRRILRVAPDGLHVTALDPYPPGRESLPADRVVAVVAGRRGAEGWIGAAIVLSFPLWSRWSAVRYWCRKISEAPDFGDRAVDSVKRKYASQVDGYNAMVDLPPREELCALMRRTFPACGSILVAGAGAGGEAIYLAREGHRVTGFDYLDEMVRAAGRNSRAAGVAVELLPADMTELDLGDRKFDGAYVTPSVYSFIPGRARRVRGLRRLGKHLVPGGTVVFSAGLISDPLTLLRMCLVWIRYLRRGARREFGDWFTWFLWPDGGLGKSFTHLFTLSRVLSEAREAGFRDCRRVGAYIAATRFTEQENSR